jgi:hypothetical protein
MDLAVLMLLERRILVTRAISRMKTMNTATRVVRTTLFSVDSWFTLNFFI